MDFVGVDDSGDISVGKEGFLEVVARFLESGVSEGTENGIELSESTFTPDNESSDLSTGGKLEEVKSVDVGNFDAWNVSNGLSEFNVFVSDNEKGSFSDGVSFASEFSLSGSDGFGVGDLLDVSVGADSLQELNNLLGFFVTFDFVVKNVGNFSNSLDSVSSGEQERSNGASSQGTGNSVSFLFNVNSSVPSSPGLKGGEHSTLSALVTEGTLTTSVGTGS